MDPEESNNESNQEENNEAGTESAASDSSNDQADGKSSDGTDSKEDELTDSHGHPGISKGKYMRDMKVKDDEIAELKAQVAKASETKEGREQLEEKIQKLESDQEEMKLDYELKLAGCINLKAAKAILEDYDGSIEKLKKDAPYLFSKSEKKGSTGKKPEGSTNSSESRLAEARKAAGIKKKE